MKTKRGGRGAQSFGLFTAALSPNRSLAGTRSKHYTLSLWDVETDRQRPKVERLVNEYKTRAIVISNTLS